MKIILGLLILFGLYLLYNGIANKEYSELKSVGVTIILSFSILLGINIYTDNLDRTPKVIECIITDKQREGYLNTKYYTTILYKGREYEFENRHLYDKVKEGDKIDIVVNFIDFKNKTTIEYVTIVNE